MNYSLKHKDNYIAFFRTKGQTVVECMIDKLHEDSLPLTFKRLIKDGYKDEFVEEETKDYCRLNEYGCELVDNWLLDREIPVSRHNYSAYIEKGSNPRKWLFENNGYSFTDCYYIEKENEFVSWSDIKKKRNDLDVYLSVKKENGFYKGQNSTLGGQLEKFWFRKDSDVMLCKRASKQYDILIVREIIASLIYKKQGFVGACDYRPVYNLDGDIVGCTCKSFTSEDTELVTAYDLLSEYNMTQVDDIWERIVELSTKYGADKRQVVEFLDMQALVDYLVTNRDRHQGNIGFLRDADSFRILSPAPVYDNGSSKYMEGRHPESVHGTTVNGLYETEIECLKHVKNIFILDLLKLPRNEEVRAILELSNGLSDSRKDALLSLYEQKKEFLRELQRKCKEGTDLRTYLEDNKGTSQAIEDNDIFDDYF